MNPKKSCPRCRSERVHRSHRRSGIDRFLYALGAEIRRCHDCRFRCASFGAFAIPLGEPATQRWTGAAIMSSGFAFCFVFLWWLIRRFTELSG